MADVETRYYHALGVGHDALLRCTDCKRLVTHAALVRRGGCPVCGTRRVTEITSLTLWEYLRLRLGLIRFPHRRAMLAEFARGR